MRGMRWTLVAVALLVAGRSRAAWADADPTINEIRIDQTGTDNDEYFELAGTPGASLDGLTYIVIGDGTAAQGSGVIETVVSLTGHSIAADGYFLVTEGTFTLRPIATVDFVVPGANPLNFENDDNVTHLLVRGFTGALNQDLDTNDDGILDVVPWTAVVDSVAVFKSSAAGNERVYSSTIVGPDGSFAPGHVYRLPDATGAWRVGAFAGGEDSPGTANSLAVATDRTIPQIQGAGHVSPFVSTKVRTTGVVVATTTNGYYLEDPVGDADLATSDGIFVFTSVAPTVVVGDSVQVEAIVQEFTPGGASSGNLSNTELAPTATNVISHGNPLPAPVVIGPSGRLPPTSVIDDDGLTSFDPSTDGVDFYESLESMRVRVLSPVAVSPTNVFGEIWVVAEDGVGTTGRNARGGITLTETDVNPERIQVQVGAEGLLPGFDPQVDVGDHLGDVTGVMGYDFGQFEVLATSTFSVTPGGLAREVTDLVRTGSRLTIAGFNTHNLDPNDADGDTDVADGQFDRLAGEIVDSLRSPDILALQEIQDDTGSIDDGTVGSDHTLARLVGAIELAGGPHYDFAYLPPVDDQDGGEPGGNIRPAFLYDATRVSLVPGSLHRIVDPNLADGDAFESSRKPLVGDFLFDGRKVTVIDVHFTSKGGSTPLFGRVQPPVNGGLAQRVAQATVVRAVVDGLLASDPAARIAIVGDFNEFDWNPSLVVLRGSGATALSNLASTHPVLERYSYVFEGNAQSLDHILVSPSLVPIAEHDVVHVNAEFADQASDHDPDVVRLALIPPPVADAGPDRTVEATGTLTPVHLDGSASTAPPGHTLTYAWTEGGSSLASGAAPTVSLGLGTHVLTLTVTDTTSGLTDDDAVTIHVVDTSPPAIVVTGLPSEIWPPSHELVRLTPTVAVTDAGDPAPRLELSITSSDGGVAADVAMRMPSDFDLRAERSGDAARTYTLVWKATDASRNVGTLTLTVTVPHDQGKKK